MSVRFTFLTDLAAREVRVDWLGRKQVPARNGMESI